MDNHTTMLRAYAEEGFEFVKTYTNALIVISTLVFAGITFRWWMKVPRCKSKVKLHGKTVIITGGNTGIGKETAEDLAIRGARVIIGCRDVEKGERTAKEIRAKIGRSSSVVVKRLDLASLQSVREFADDIMRTEPHVNILINNAGIACCPEWRTEEGYEMQFGVNHLGHFLLTLLLLPRIRASAPSRIVNVSAIAHSSGKIHFDDINLEKNYNPFTAYFQSKLANILFTRELAKRLTGTAVTVYALHPGVIKSELQRYVGKSTNFLVGLFFKISAKLFFITPKEGAQTTIHCAVSEDVKNETGLYYSECKVKEPAAVAKDDEVAKKLWEVSERMVKAKFPLKV